MEAFGHSTKIFGISEELRYYEGVLEEGERVAVCGVGSWEVDPDGVADGYRDQPRRLVMAAATNTDDAKLLVSDDPRVLG